ncbi:MAG: tRNA uridine(34) 5-carboxymethylaminomethyl modification radical SAM/GNAT enzyme Elp3 [Thermoplasmata archaeon]|nr:MAG: tRNA uridine(34) 5-carboxymethylaminomethyl modification radical SAM/GNAT enzyme Elp3 [Thermoplasmata archaeon]
MEIINHILSQKICTKEELHRAKIRLCRKHKINTIPPDSKILAHLPHDIPEWKKETAYSILRKKPMRTISGVAIVAVMTSPEKCPHGQCIPCPGGPEHNTPQSYTGYEPAAMRAISNKFDPYLQTKNRLDQLKTIGHTIDKIDLILMGGTFTSRDPIYQQWFVKRCFDALNRKESSTLEMAKKKNETAKSRCIGLTIETRPDWFHIQHADNALQLGATRVELGVQTIYDNILHNIKRGHTVIDTIHATRIAKNSGFKVCYHLMPGLPGSDEEKDIETFRTIFTDQRFKPDMIKIYPTLIIKGTKLYKMWKNREYNPLDTEKAAEIVTKIKKHVPPWVRIQRIQRDVPITQIAEGVKKSNLRQIIEENLKRHGENCKCIRCREIGHKMLREKPDIHEENIKIINYQYQASDSTEIFISLEDKKHDILFGYLRLRDIVSTHRPELQKKPCMIIRELKILGREIPIGQKNNNGWQHRGYGKQLIKEAEKICYEEFDKKRLFVLSGIGVKEYYRKLGFTDDNIYLSKTISP